jgi:hypothetical protein
MQESIALLKNVFPYILALVVFVGCSTTAYRLSQKKERFLKQFNDAHNEQEEYSIIWYRNFLTRMQNGQLIGMMVFIFAIIIFNASISSIIDVSAKTLYFILGHLIVAISYLIWMIRKNAQMTLDESINNDKRPPVLFLRSFDKDGEAPLTIYDAVSENSKKLITYEDIAIGYATMIGPVIAIASPYIAVKDVLGAAKGHFDDWQSTILSYMETASLIIMRPYDSEGVLWEFEQVIKFNYLYKTILYVNFGGKETRKNRLAFEENKVAYENFRQAILGNYAIEIGDYNAKAPRKFFDEQNFVRQADDFFEIPIFRRTFYYQYIIAKRNGSLEV